MSDKRSVATDALETLGTLIDDKQKRDAIHIAVEPVIAGEMLRPGHHITVVDGVAKRTATGEGLGIVDPFLSGPVNPGQRFWFLMYPRTIKSLRHVWAHPDFPNEVGTPAPDKSASEQWLRNFCDNNDCPGYYELLEMIVNNGDHEYLIVYGSDAHGEIPAEFWVHVEIVLGQKLRYHPRYLSCSC